VKIVRSDGSGRVIFDGGASKRRIGDEVALSADGQRVAFSVWNPASPDEVAPIVVMDPDGSHFRVVTHDEGHDDFPSFSPDGSRLVYRLGDSSERQHTQRGLRIVSLTDGKTTKLTSGWDDFPTWSPAGDRIAFTGFETGDYEIYTIRPDGTGLRQLTHSHGNDAHPVWSPDGKWIAFVSSRMGLKDEAVFPGSQDYGEIFVMRADGTDVRQLTDDQWEEGVAGWAPSFIGRAPSFAAPLLDH
jgi:Tol biopolymer transport system component